MNKKSWFALLLLLGLLMAVEAFAIHETFVSTVLGGNDFYPRWAGARALLVDNRNPYSDEVTQEIIAVLDPEDRGLNSFSFAYPLHAIFVFFPLAYLSYDWAISIWIVVVQWLAIGSLALLLKYHRWLPSPLTLAGLLLATIFFYPVARSILLGQFIMHVLFALALTVLALRQERDWLAGAAFAITSIKPQAILLVGAWFVVWAIKEKRYAFIWGLLSAGAVLLLASLALLPSWPLNFLAGLGGYSDLASGKEPLEVLLALFVSGNVDWLKGILLAIMGLTTLFIWWKGLRAEISFDGLLHWSIVINLLAFFQTGTTNQVLLMIPFLAWLAVADGERRAWLKAALAGIILVAIWILFLQTIQGDYEHPVLFLPLPLLAFFVSSYKLWRSQAPKSNVALATETQSE